MFYLTLRNFDNLTTRSLDNHSYFDGMALSSRLGALSALAADYGDDDDEGEEEKEQDKKDIVMVIATTTTGENMEVDKKVKMEAVVAEDDKSIVKKVEISTMEQDKNEIETALAIVKKEGQF